MGSRWPEAGRDVSIRQGGSIKVHEASPTDRRRGELSGNKSHLVGKNATADVCRFRRCPGARGGGSLIYIQVHAARMKCR